MNTKDRKAFKELIEDLRQPTAMAYSSNPEYDEGIDWGREDTADRIEYLINELTKKTP